MKVLKLHWPVLILIIIYIVSTVDFRAFTFRQNDFDKLAMGFLFFYAIMPVFSLFASLWYGRKMRSGMKWIIILLLGIAQVLLIVVSTGEVDVKYYSIMSLCTMIPSAVGMLLGHISLIRKIKREGDDFLDEDWEDD